MPIGTWNLAAGEHMSVQWSVKSPVAVVDFRVELVLNADGTTYVLAGYVPSSARSASLTIPGDIPPGSYYVRVWAYVAGYTQGVSFGNSSSGTVRK